MVLHDLHQSMSIFHHRAESGLLWVFVALAELGGLNRSSQSSKAFHFVALKLLIVSG